jgi:hypothetical protein
MTEAAASGAGTNVKALHFGNLSTYLPQRDAPVDVMAPFGEEQAPLRKRILSRQVCELRIVTLIVEADPWGCDILAPNLKNQLRIAGEDCVPYDCHSMIASAKIVAAMRRPLHGGARTAS